jgi:hypothetical protein
VHFLKIFKTKEPLGPVFQKAKKKKKCQISWNRQQMTDSFIEGFLWSVLRIFGNLQLLHIRICSQIFENSWLCSKIGYEFPFLIPTQLTQSINKLWDIYWVHGKTILAATGLGTICYFYVGIDQF